MKSVALHELLPAARRKFGGGFDTHLRELPDGRRQVIGYHKVGWVGTRDASGVEVIAETAGNWESLWT